MTPEERKARLIGALFIAIGAIAFSGKGVIVKLAYRYGVDAVTLLTLRMLLRPCSVAASPGGTSPRLMAVASTVLPIILTSGGIRRIGANHASIVASVGPIATIALGAIFLGEAITAIQLAGAALVLAGVLTISLQRKAGE